MKIILKIEGEIKHKNEKIECELEVPDNFKPSFVTTTKIIGCIRFLKEKFAQTFITNPSIN